jgi:hypothetical protein
MPCVKFCLAVFALIAGLAAAQAQPVCAAPPEAGYRVVPSLEVTGVTDGAPYAAGGDWVVDRTTTLLPLCNYFSPVGSYSLRSYSLDPFTKAERVVLCRGGTPVAPYAGPCSLK